MDVMNRLRGRKKALADLGPSRDTKEQQYDLLLKLATRFQTIRANALSAHYASDDLFDKYSDFKIATEIVKRNEKLSEDFAKVGHTHQFVEDGLPYKSGPPFTVNPPPTVFFGFPGSGGNQPVNTGAPGPGGNQPAKTGVPGSGGTQLGKSGPRPSRSWDKPEDFLEDIVENCQDIQGPSDRPIVPWLTEIYDKSRGYELGTFDTDVLRDAFRKQSVKWEALALGYTSDIVYLVHNFTVKLLSVLCDNENLKQALLRELQETLLSK